MAARKPGIGRSAAVLALLFVAACSDDENDDDDATTAPPTTTVSTTTTSTTTPRPSTTTTVPGPACAGAAVAPEGDVTYLGAELDGVAGDDTTYTVLAADGWHLRVDLGDGGALDELLSTPAADVARVAAASDVDGDGTAELWVQVGTGASATIMGLYDVDGCDLEPVLLEGAAAQFAIGGPVLLLQGLACGDRTITHLDATSDDGLAYATLDVTYELQGGELVRVGDETGTLTATDPELAAYSAFDC